MMHRLVRSRFYLWLVLAQLCILWLPALPAQASLPLSRQAESQAVITPGAWTLTGSMTTPRAAHTLTLLPNGLVLAVGGADLQDLPQSSAEIYDPSTGAWTSTSSMTMARAWHTATLLPNGKVLVAGGLDLSNASIATAELYDPTTQTWTSTGSLHTTRHEHGAVLLPDGKVLVMGGWSPTTERFAITSAEIYDATTGLWTPTGDLNLARTNPQPILLPDGRVLVAPHVNGEIFDPATHTWTLSAPMSVERSSQSSILLRSGLVLVAGGYVFTGESNTAELFDPATETWSPTGSLSTARYAHITVSLATGDVLVAGGYGVSTSYLASAEIYHPASGTWSSASSMTTERASVPSAVLLPNGQVLVAGGRNHPSNFAMDSAELYTPAIPVVPALGNLVANPGFEFDANGDTRPDDWTSNPVVTRSQEQVHRGDYAMQHSVDLDSSYTIQQTVSDIQPGSPYALSAWASVPPINDANGFSLTMQVEWRDATDAITGTTALLPITQTTQGWMLQEGVVTSPLGAATAAVQIDLHNLDGTLYVDDLYFGTMLGNAGFEQDFDQDDRADGWLPEELALRTEVDVHGGSYALHLQGANNATYDLASTPLADIVAGKLYRVDAFVKIPALQDEFRFDIVIEWQDAQGGTISTKLVHRYTKATRGKWSALHETVAAPVGSSQAVLRLVVTGLTGAIYMDDLAIYPYEPSADIHIPLILR